LSLKSFLLRSVLILLFVTFPLFAKKPNLLLLKVYQDQNITGWVMSEKLDGVRAYWDGEKLLTRSGHIIHAPKWFTKGYPPFEIDGELWTKRGDFENIVSIVRDRVPSDKWREVKHYIFEVPHAKGALFERLKRVKSYESSIIKIIPQIKIKNKKDLQRFLKEVEEKGGEGVVVRDPNTLYIDRRSNKALKVKTFLDRECKVVGYHQGHGKFDGLMGSIICKMDDNQTIKIGSGFSEKQRYNPPAIGTVITFKFKGYTKYGKPRFPVFLRVREGL